MLDIKDTNVNQKIQDQKLIQDCKDYVKCVKKNFVI